MNMPIKPFVFLLLLIESSVWAMPAQVILIRHGEKPEIGKELNERGWQRANALPGFFKGNPDVNEFGFPVAIYAMAPKDDEGSVRAIQTVTPLAQVLHQKILSNYKKKSIEALVEEIRTSHAYDGKMVLICWEHKVIPEIALALGLKNGPQKWGSVYDRAWVLTFKGNEVSHFKNVAQHLLPGDSERF